MPRPEHAAPLGLSSRESSGEHVDHHPVRRDSRAKGSFERDFYRPLDKWEASAILRAARLYERHTKQPGSRQGALGSCGLEVLSELVHLCNKQTGRLEPSWATLTERTCRSKDAVAKALNRLERSGFLERARRYEPLTRQGPGPSIRQASNAYRLLLPEGARLLLGVHGRRPYHLDATTEDNNREREKLDREGFETRDVGLAVAALRSAIHASPLSRQNPSSSFDRGRDDDE
jgi:hypothetical protein